MSKKEEKMTIPQVLKAIELIVRFLQTGEKATEIAFKQAPYGVIHRREPVTYNGLHGWLVWDWILWNDITFEEISSGKKFVIASKFSDKETEELFNSLVEKYGEGK